MLKGICHECLYEYCEWSIIVLNCNKFLYEYYKWSIIVLYWTLTVMNGWMSNTKGLLFCYTKCYIIIECLLKYYKGSIVVYTEP
jgi:hypothetical protein